MIDLLKYLQPQERDLLQKSSFPQWTNPMLATLTNDRFSREDWLYECKFDGERALTFYQKGKVTLFSRNQHNVNKKYPELIRALLNQQHNNFILDGEIVMYDHGVTSFSKLQGRMGLHEISLQEALKIPVYYCIFDILFLNGYDLRQLSLKTRRDILKDAIVFKNPLQFSKSIVKAGEEFFKEACKKGWEGIIAKRSDAPYQGRRSRDWLKFKCHRSQELIIIGYTSPQGQREGFGALLVGYFSGKELRFAGKVGTGFSTQTLKSLKKIMDKHVTLISPIEERIHEPKTITWLKPVLVGEFEFAEWTPDGKLRHSRFKGLRDDMYAKDIIREKPQ